MNGTIFVVKRFEINLDNCCWYTNNILPNDVNFLNFH